MEVIILTDTHGKLRRTELENAITEKNPDCFFCLGDITYSDYEIIQDTLAEMECKVPVLAVLGNHDPCTLLDEVQKDFFPEIINLDCKTTEVCGFTIGGFAGSVKYKNGDYYCVRTQEQAQSSIKALPKVDVLLCHSQPSFDKQVLLDVTEEGISQNAHNGLYAIGEYIIQNNPRYVFHGHLHDRFFEEHGDTIVVCCYGVDNDTVHL